MKSGLRALQEHKFEKAKGYLQKALTGPNKSLVDRAQVHILTCRQASGSAGVAVQDHGRALRLCGGR